MIFDKLLHVVLRQVVGFDVCFDKLFIGDGSQVGQLLQLHQELLEVQLHQSPAFVATFLHVSVATEQDKMAEGKRANQNVLKNRSTMTKKARSFLYFFYFNS